VRKLVGGDAEGVPTASEIKQKEDAEVAETADEVADSAAKVDSA
jgi:hypothetical protein